MNDMLRSLVATSAIAAAYEKDGYLFPYNVTSEAEAVEVDEATAVNVLLHAGQVSFHHGHMFHASGPNRTNSRRLGVAILRPQPSLAVSSIYARKEIAPCPEPR